jgi:Leucine-rich repeat (LRR) protein
MRIYKILIFSLLFLLSFIHIKAQRRLFFGEIDSGYVFSFDSILVKPEFVHTVNIENKKIHLNSDRIKEFSSLKRLAMVDCEIRSLPKGLFKCTALEELLISGNPIRCLPKEIGQLSNLTSINACKMQLEDLPDCLADLENLTMLIFNVNRFKHLPKVLYKIKNLKTVDLSGCPIPQSEIDAFRKARPEVVLYFDDFFFWH